MHTWAKGCGGSRQGRTLNVLEAAVLYLLCVRQEGFTQDVEGTQVSELPVSKQPVNCLGGVPSWKTPKYCGQQAAFVMVSARRLLGSRLDAGRQLYVLAMFLVHRQR